MSFSFSSPQVSPTPNVLFDPLMAGKQQAQTNQLQMQQLDLTAADHEQVGRLAAGLLNIKDPAARAQAYAQGVGVLQSQGLAKYAPPTLPDEQSLQMLVNQTIPAQTQAEWLQNLTANKAYTNAGNTASTAAPGTTTGSGVATTTPGSGATIGQRQNNPGNLTFAGQPGAQPGQGNRFASFPDMPSGVAATADQLALYQTQHNINTVRGAVTRWVSDPKADLTSYIGDISKALGVGPDDPIDLTDPAVQAKFIQAQFPHESAGGGYVLNPADVAKGVQMAAANRGRAVQAPGTAIASTAPATAQPGQPVPTQVAGPPMVSTAPGGPPGATTAAAPTQSQATPAGSPAPPQLQPVNANGLTDVQQRQVNALAANPQTTLPQRMAAEQAFRNQNIQLQQKQFSDWVQVQQLQTSQGQLSVSQQNSALEYWKAAHPDAKVTMTGGEIITQDPRTGQEIAPRIQVTPQRADTAAMAIVSRLGPKVANGNATPDEQAQYAVAVDSYRQPVLRENPVSKETVRVNTRELPAGFPEPPSLGGGGAPGGAGTAGGANVVMPGLSPQQQQIERNKGRYDIAVEDLKHDRGEINAISDAGRAAQQDNLRVKEMQDILQHVDTGPGTENAAKFRAWIARWMPGELSRWDGSGANLSNPAAIEMFQKLGFVGAVTQERGSTPRGGYQATKMFQQFNPGAQLLTSSNQGLLAQRMIANQAEADYAQGAQDHYNTQRERLKSPEQDYDPLTSFDAKWQAQRNPQVYAAAIGALGGQDSEMWSRGLNADEIKRVKDVVTRADPNAVIHMPGEGKVVLQPNAKPLPPGFKVQ